jgi:hypothetical protein
LGIVPRGSAVEGCQVVEPAVVPLVVVVDVGGDRFRGLVEGVELVPLDAAFFEVAESHGSMNAWLYGSR